MKTRPLPAAGRGLAVKVCGLTRPGDAALAARLGAVALGVVLAPSPRRVAPGRAEKVLAAAPPGVARFGVFVDPEPAFVADVAAACGLDWVQLSGRETPAQVAAVRAALAAIPGAGGRTPGILKAVHVRGPADLAALSEYAAADDDEPDYEAPALLLDAPPLDGRMGGTGRRFDWSAAAALDVDRRRITLAGGLDAGNLAEAAAAVRPAMVDVSSGVESAPGIKDPARLAAFLAAARQIEEPAWRP